jgi:hypothetical protein
MAADAKYKIELQAISGLDQKQFVTGAAIAMDPEGDVTGFVQTGGGGRTGFLWPPKQPPRLLTAGSEPRAIDAKGRIYYYLNGKFFVHQNRQDAQLNLTGLSDVRAAAGDGWFGFDSATASPTSLHPAHGRWDGSGPKDVAVLGVANTDKAGVTLAIDRAGRAAGVTSMYANTSWCGEDPSNEPGRAAVWRRGDSTRPIVLLGKNGESWTPQVARAISSDGWVAGSTSPMEPANPTWLKGRDDSLQKPPQKGWCNYNLYTTHAFVSRRRWFGDYQSELLPPVNGDNTMTVLTPLGINSKHQIVGNRDGTDSDQLSGLSGVVALLWTRHDGTWKVERLDTLVDPPPNNCTKPLVLNTAYAINDRGQITGGASCGAALFLYRLTPVH